MTAISDDPYLWLEEIEGEHALDQVRRWNAATAAPLLADPAFADTKARARNILDDTRRVASPSMSGGMVYNFWRDADHPRGLWRRSVLADYVGGKPDWDVLIDVDALALSEAQNWIWAGSILCHPAAMRAMISLSDGGQDAIVWREFDLIERQFVTDGFVLPEGKSSVAWLDSDTLLVATDFGPGTLTSAGYAAHVRRWSRGMPLATATPLAQVPLTDTRIAPAILYEGETSWPMIVRSGDFWSTMIDHIAADGSLHR